MLRWSRSGPWLTIRIISVHGCVDITLLKKRVLQCWIVSHCLCEPHHLNRRLTVASSCVSALLPWRKSHLVRGPQNWKLFGRATIYLFGSKDNAHCPPFFSLSYQYAPLGMQHLYTFPLVDLILPVLERLRQGGLSLILVVVR